MKLTVTGGIYLESCISPGWHELWGSGLRAARAINSRGGDVELYSYLGEEEEMAVQAMSREWNFDIHTERITNTVCFDYMHGFSVPTIFPSWNSLQNSKEKPLNINGEAILRFGFIEGDAIVHGRRVVYDPQSPNNPEAFHQNGSTAESLAIVLNVSEGKMLTGKTERSEVAQSLLHDGGADVVVLKCGSLGALVVDERGEHEICAYQTKKVWPIGSGDVFVSVFAQEWAGEEIDPRLAAAKASLATAAYCESRQLSAIADLSGESRWPVAACLKNDQDQKKVYLAGPFFTLGEIWLINEARQALRSQGLHVFSPLHDVGRGSAKEVYQKDIDALVDCDIIFACLDGLDSGTLYEVGYAKSLGKPVVVYSLTEQGEDLKMLEGGECLIIKDFVTAVYKTAWLAYE